MPNPMCLRRQKRGTVCRTMWACRNYGHGNDQNSVLVQRQASVVDQDVALAQVEAQYDDGPAE